MGPRQAAELIERGNAEAALRESCERAFVIFCPRSPNIPILTIDLISN
jgi:hypothetical protein